VTFTRHFAHWPPGQPRALDLPKTTVYENLVESATRHPQRAAIDFYGSRITYAELKRQVDALAGFLQRRFSVARGERVLLYAQNSPQFVIAYYAILRADAVVVPVNPMNRTEELRHYVEDSDASVAIVGQDVLREIEPLGLTRLLPLVYSDYLSAPTDLPLPDFVRLPGSSWWKEALNADLGPGPQLAGPDDLAVMPYTSGTTGKPKGCMHTHSSVQATTVPYLYWRGAQEASVVLCAMPMFHVTGMQAGMNAPIHIAATLVVL
jgi:fatty-acyl-CoA synthase